MRHPVWAICLIGLCVGPSTARAQVPPAPVPSSQADAPEQDAPELGGPESPAVPVEDGEAGTPGVAVRPPGPDQMDLSEFRAELEAMRAELAVSLEESEAESEALRQEVDVLQQAIEAGAERAIGNLTRIDNVKIRPAGYIDVGFFGVTGSGIGYARDEGNLLFPDRADNPWVFYGDPWAPTINSQGDVADIGLDRTNIDRFDPIANGGAPSFIINNVNQAMIASIGDSVLMEASVNFEPRTGVLGSPGDYMSVDLAYIELVPFRALDIHVFAGKFEPVFGVEYRNRRASDRLTITPSIISRYLVASQTGVKVRGSIQNELFFYNLAVTNGGASTERFGTHFYNETDANAGKTVSGRLSLVPRTSFFLELGGSAQAGSQDNQPDSSIVHSQVGADLKLRVGDFNFLTEWLVFSRAQGGGLADAPPLDARGWYAEAFYRIIPPFAPYARVDRRVADLTTDTNVYLTDTLRVTGGAHFDISFNVILKAEYMHILELGTPEIENNVYTSSMVFRY